MWIKLKTVSLMFIVDRFLGLVNGSPELVKIFIDRIQQLFYYSFIKIIDTLLKNKLTSMPVYPVFIRLFLGKYRDDLNLLRDCLVTIIRWRKLLLLVLLQKKYLYTCKNIVMKPNEKLGWVTIFWHVKKGGSGKIMHCIRGGSC